MRKTTEITFHSDGCGRQAHMAINVKTHHMNFADVSGATEQQRESAWEFMIADWWEEATEIAKEHGYSAVFSEGRSGGWLVPELTSGYPSAEDRAEVKRFLKFRKAIEQHLTYAPELYRMILTDMVENVRREQENAERIIREFCQAM